jgi:hypothetical protein
VKGVLTINTEELLDYDPQEEINYIIRRLENRREAEGMDLDKAVNQALDVHGEFIDRMHDENANYSSDDERDHIIKNTDLNLEFVDLLLWYKMCYEMELNMWEFIGDCLYCDGGPLFEKEMPGEDFSIKTVCGNCGKEMVRDEDDQLVKLSLDDDDNLTIVKDFERFCKFIDTNTPPLTQKRGVLSNKDAFTLNNSLFFKREVPSATYRQDQYYGLDLLFELALTAGLYRKVFTNSQKFILQRTERLAGYEELNEHEKYVFLLETFWCDYDFEQMFAKYSLSSGASLIRNFLITLIKATPGTPLKDIKYIEDCFSRDFKIVIRFSCFGFCTYEWVEERKNFDEDIIKEIVPTKLGRSVGNILIREGLPYFKHAHLFSHIIKTSENNKAKGAFHQLLARSFPKGVVQNTLEKIEQKKITGTYVLKVMLGDRIWRKIRMPSDQSLESLHLTIQDAFLFNNDHLYAFYFKGGSRTVSGIDPWPLDSKRQDGPYTDEVYLEDCELYPGHQFTYIFDYRRNWEFKIVLLEIDETGPVPSFPEVIEAKGDAPKQYSWFD